MIRITHVITGLDTGGAEMMLYKLLSRTDRSVFQSDVLSLTTIGPVGEIIHDLGVPVEALGLRRGVPTPLDLLRLAWRLRQRRPNVIQTWMYHADLLGGLASAITRGPPVVWCIQNSTLHPERTKRSTICTMRVCALLSRWLPRRIVAVAEASRRVHEQLGYTPHKFVVIPNAIDVEAFRADEGSRSAFRTELRIPEDTLLIGMVARFDAQKDHRNFIIAAGLLSEGIPQAHFVLCGDGITWENKQLAGWIDSAGIRPQVHLLGRRRDVSRITAALDIASLSSSYGEALPNVIGEAMACGVPCVTTDVGDSGVLVGETGRIVPSKDPSALAQAWRELIEAGPEERLRLGRAARRRIERSFALPAVVALYENLYKELAAGTRP